MPYLVREGLFIGNINDAAEVLQKESGEFTHLLSLLNSISISFFSEWKPGLSIPSKEIRKVVVGELENPSASDRVVDVLPKKLTSPGKLPYSLELAGPGMNLVRLAVPLKDTEDEDLLDYLDVCLDFIDRSRNDGSILVHCFAGVSRSAAVITAYLMKTEQKCLEGSKQFLSVITPLLLHFMFIFFDMYADAFESLRQCCEFVCPNDGFLDQLKMFEDMGFKVDPASLIYKRFRLKVLGDSYNRGHKIDSSIFGADPGMPQSKSSDASPKQNEPTPAYRCKKCRRIVALQDNIIGHNPGEGETCFDWRKRRGGNPFNRSGEPECSSMFIEPLRWMTTVEEGALEGKLSCIHCEARLGYFNWSGIQCSCGSWITPAFQIHKNRVDVSTL